MKLEIDIDEDYYKIICKRVEKNKPYHSPYEYEVIADGNPIEQELKTKGSYHPIISGNFQNPPKVESAETEFIPSITPQEPFKPMVEIDLYSVIKQKYIEREVLDKIRAEIEEYRDGMQWNSESLVKWDAINYILEQILDKYKAETER